MILPITRYCPIVNNGMKNIFFLGYGQKLHELGLMTCGVPAEYGGPGIDHLGQCIISEEISRGDAGLATTMAASTLLGPDPVYIAATHEQKKWWYGQMMEGVITAFCLTEPGAGSDAAGLSTRCVKDGDDYILNGTKQFISNGGVAGLYTVFATLDKNGAQRHMLFYGRSQYTGDQCEQTRK